eukprot:CAMPEP_0194298498 /NCGR_PEP_ID=MMETSP0169-20130528/60193_1 /TAXON_ID=218684 /ORGANISM="Corethron pennatum, Strain L29A3" /LENGTH=591 /DNA_ID=CAMNT_0039048493 /DNA_START=737 /DNA_END=2513 /DNA_ORIENTATION=+
MVTLNRAKRMTKSVTKQVVEELNQAATHKQSILAIENALTAFNHRKEKAHDEEVKTGAATALYKQLALILHTNGADEEMMKLCSALEMVYRCSDEYRTASFQAIGDGLLTVMLQVIARSASGNIDHADLAIKSATRVVRHLSQADALKVPSASGNIDHADLAIKSATRVLRHLSQADALKVPMANHEGLLTALLIAIESEVSNDARVDALWILANLAYADKNEVMMACHQGLLDTVVEVAYEDIAGAQKQAAKVLSNLSCPIENKIPMAKRSKLLDALMLLMLKGSEKTAKYAAGAIQKLSIANKIPMAKRSKLLDALMLLMLKGSEKTAKYAAGAIQKLSIAKGNRVRLANHGNGSLLDALVKVAADDKIEDDTIQRAMKTLSNIAYKETAVTMGERDTLIDTICKVTHDSEISDTRSAGLSTLRVLATGIQYPEQCYSDLLKSMVSLLRSQHREYRVAALESLKSHAIYAKNRIPIADTKGMLEALGSCASEGAAEERELSVTTVLNLTMEHNNLVFIASCYDVLSALIDVLQSGENREDALQAIVNLASQNVSMEYLAKHEGLMMTMLKFSTDDPSLKNTFKRLAAVM